MSNHSPHLQQRLKNAAYLLVIGLLAEALTLYGTSPTSFLLFTGVGALLVIIGMAILLMAIVSE